MRTRIKICGITRLEDALLAAQLGVDAIGLVFCAKSPRNLNIAQARELVVAIPPFVTVVGLFMDSTAEQVEDVLQQVPLHCLQFHGSETESFCNRFGYSYIKSVPMMEANDITLYTAAFPSASGFLLDAIHQGEAGGQGRTFDWQTIPQDFDRPLIVAGGLTAENVAKAIRASQCYAVDVSSGVEQSKGIKSAEKMREFIQQVQIVNESGKTSN